MNNWKCAITLATCCCINLTVAPSASADFVGVVVSRNTDADTTNLCTNANGPFVPVPLTVCSVSIAFDEVGDKLLSVAFADLQVFNGRTPDVFYQNPFSSTDGTAPSCAWVADLFPDLICDSFITIGYPCTPDPAGTDRAFPDPNVDLDEFNFAGHVSGGWFNARPFNTQGEAFSPVNADGEVLIAQFSVAQGLTVSGNLTVFVQGDSPVPPLPPECGDCPADKDNSDHVDQFDLALLLKGWGPVEPSSECFDANEDGDIDAYDLAALLNNWGPCDGVTAVEAFEVSFMCQFPCPADLDSSGAVGAADLAILLSAWGPVPTPDPPDFDGDGVVGAFDLALLLSVWGPCP